MITELTKRKATYTMLNLLYSTPPRELISGLRWVSQIINTLVITVPIKACRTFCQERQ